MRGLERSALFCLGALLAAAAPAVGHDSWIVADRERLDVGGEVRVSFCTGHESFPASEVETNPDRVASWRVYHGGERRDITGYGIRDGALAATSSFDQPGLHIAAVALRPRFIELPAEKFTGYLTSEHAAEALAARKRDGTDDEPGRELYSKLGKTFIRVGAPDASDTSYLTPVGHPLEIVPLSDPTAWAPGDVVRVRVLRNGRPIAGLHVSTGHASSSAHDYVEVKPTDEAGEVTLRLDRAGHWLIRAVVIEPIDHPEADWESYWASLTVDLPAE